MKTISVSYLGLNTIKFSSIFFIGVQVIFRVPKIFQSNSDSRQSTIQIFEKNE